MSDEQYLVVKRSDKWWVLVDGRRQGPFVTHDEALKLATHQAKLNERTGTTAEVSWDDPDDGMPTVYKSPSSEGRGSSGQP